MNWVSAGDRRVPVGVLRVHLRRPRREHYCLHREEGHQTQSVPYSDRLVQGVHQLLCFFPIF